jgi:hypothetical protein
MTQLAKGVQGITSLVKLNTNASFALKMVVLKQTACKDIRAEHKAIKVSAEVRHTRVENILVKWVSGHQHYSGIMQPQRPCEKSRGQTASLEPA